MKTFKDLSALVRSYLAGAITRTTLKAEIERLYLDPRLTEEEAHSYLIGVWVRIGECDRHLWTEDVLRSHLLTNLTNYEAWFANPKPTFER